MYTGILCLTSAAWIFPQRRELKALAMFIDTAIATPPLLTISLAIFITKLIASTADLPLLNPYCLSDMFGPILFNCCQILSVIIFSKIFPTSLIRHISQYVEAELSSFFLGFGTRINSDVFHSLGNFPCFRHIWLPPSQV